jgi:broad specificity phosphatase PhoE
LDLVVTLIRHGDYHQPEAVPSALLPYALTREGEQQARMAVEPVLEFSKKYDIDCLNTIDCSMQLRAWQTANLLAERMSSQLHQSFNMEEFPDLSERSVGAVANLSVSEIEKIISRDPRMSNPPKYWKSNSEYCLPFQGAESLMEAGKRVATHIESINQRGLKIIVGHGASIRHAAVHLGLLSLESVSKVSMHHAIPIFIGKKGAKWRLLAGDWKQRQHSNDGDEIGV